MLVGFLLSSIETLATYVLRVFRLSFWKFGPTEIRILLGPGNVVLWFRPNPTVPRLSYRLFDFGGVIAMVGMALMLFVSVACHTASLYREETQ